MFHYHYLFPYMLLPWFVRNLTYFLTNPMFKVFVQLGNASFPELYIRQFFLMKICCLFVINFEIKPEYHDVIARFYQFRLTLANDFPILSDSSPVLAFEFELPSIFICLNRCLMSSRQLFFMFLFRIIDNSGVLPYNFEQESILRTM